MQPDGREVYLEHFLTDVFAKTAKGLPQPLVFPGDGSAVAGRGSSPPSSRLSPVNARVPKVPIRFTEYASEDGDLDE